MTTTSGNPKDLDASEGEMDSSSKILKIQADMLWGEYVERRTHARHVEATRTSAINYVLLLTSVLIAAIAVDRDIAEEDLIFAAVIVFLGCFSFLASMAYVQRYDESMRKARAARRELNSRFFSDQPSGHQLCDITGKGMDDSVAKREDRPGKSRNPSRRLPTVNKLTQSSHALWLLLPFCVAASGIALFLLAL